MLSQPLLFPCYQCPTGLPPVNKLDSFPLRFFSHEEFELANVGNLIFIKGIFHTHGHWAVFSEQVINKQTNKKDSKGDLAHIKGKYCVLEKKQQESPFCA